MIFFIYKNSMFHNIHSLYNIKKKVTYFFFLNRANSYFIFIIYLFLINIKIIILYFR